MAVDLGKTYRDISHGIEGIAESRTVFRNGCVRVGLEHLDKDGKITTDHFDEQDLVLAASGVSAVAEPAPPPPPAKSGGPRDAVERRADVS